MFPTPSVLDEYLRSIGYFKTDTGLEFKIGLPDFNVQHWGRVDADNHWKYKNWPHPFVAACQIREDLRYTRTGKDRIYQIEELTPADYKTSAVTSSSNEETTDKDEETSETVSPGYSTANLLGWQPCRRMHQECSTALENCDIVEDEFRVDGPAHFCLNMDLMRMSANILRLESSTYATHDKVGLSCPTVAPNSWKLRMKVRPCS